ncbi:MAG: hypothetical protein LBV33_05395 [Lachnospiraceae bacterium]|jgi:hypothetical protein|nr:hypothetical protein [Lachnospiraceae bacterium]
MLCISNLEGNLTLKLNFDEAVTEDTNCSDFEKWVTFTLRLDTINKFIEINKSINAYMNFFEIKKIYQGLNNLLVATVDKHDERFTHHSSENYFEITFEYFNIDDCFYVELWFIIAGDQEGRITGYDTGFRFPVHNDEMKKFVKGFYEIYKNASQ